MAGKRNKDRDIQAAGVNWLEQLADEVCVPLAPEGWYPLYQICARLARDHQCVRRILKKKQAEMKQFRHILENGNTVIMPHYKVNF